MNKIKIVAELLYCYSSEYKIWWAYNFCCLGTLNLAQGYNLKNSEMKK